MTYTYELVLYYSDQSIEIIKKSTNIKDIDIITKQYKDNEELKKKYNCENVKIRYKKNNSYEYIELLYKKDIYDPMVVKQKYMRHLIKNNEELIKFLKKVSRSVCYRTDPKNTFDERCLSIYNNITKLTSEHESLLFDVLTSYFSEKQASYRKLRDVYMDLKNKGYDVAKKILIVEPEPEREKIVVIGINIINAQMLELFKKYDGILDYMEIVRFYLSNGYNLFEIKNGVIPVVEGKSDCLPMIAFKDIKEESKKRVYKHDENNS